MYAKFIAIAVSAFVLALATPAQARRHHHHHSRAIQTDYIHTLERVVSHPWGCPRVAFCGCGASVDVFGHPVRALYLASAWFKFPRTSAAPGMVAVRSHHVFVIREVNGDGTVVAYDPNSGGHLTRVHTISLAGYSVRDPHARAGL